MEGTGTGDPLRVNEQQRLQAPWEATVTLRSSRLRGCLPGLGGQPVAPGGLSGDRVSAGKASQQGTPSMEDGVVVVCSGSDHAKTQNSL